MFSRRCRDCFILGALALAWFLLAPFSGAEGAATHYELTQEGFPRSTTQFDDRALRVCPEKRVTLLAVAPNWEITLFNPDSHRIYHTSEAHFRDRWLFYPVPPMLKLAPPVVKHNGRMLGESVTHLISGADSEQEAAIAFERWGTQELWFRVHSKPLHRDFDRYQYTVWNKSAPLAVCHILQDIYRVPLDSHVPLLFLSMKRGRRGAETRLLTKSISLKPGSVDRQAPVGYQVCNDPNSVWYDPKMRESVEDAAQLMDH